MLAKIFLPLVAVINHAKIYLLHGFLCTLVIASLGFILKVEGEDCKANTFSIFLDIFHISSKEAVLIVLLSAVCESPYFSSSLLIFGIVRPFDVCRFGWYEVVPNCFVLLFPDYSWG